MVWKLRVGGRKDEKSQIHLYITSLLHADSCGYMDTKYILSWKRAAEECKHTYLSGMYSFHITSIAEPLSPSTCRENAGKVLERTARLQPHASVFVKSRHGKKQSVTQGSGGEASKEAETDKQLCLQCLGSTLGSNLGTLACVLQSPQVYEDKPESDLPARGKATTFTGS